MQPPSGTSGPTSATPAIASPAGIPLFHAAWLFSLGIAASSALWLRPPLLIVCLVLATAACIAAALRAQRLAWLPMAAVWLLLGAWAAEMEPHPAPAPELLSLSNGLLRTVEGTVVAAAPIRPETEQSVDEPSVTAPAQRIDLRLSTMEVVTDSDDSQQPVSGEVRLIVRWPAPPSQNQPSAPAQTFRCGDQVRAVIRPLPPDTYRDPGAFNRATFLLDQGITATSTIQIARIDRLPPSNTLTLPQRFSCTLATAQQQSAQRLLSLPAVMRGLPAPLRLSEDDAIMLTAMITGDRTFLAHSLRVGFERTGSFHMLVVSGFHLAIVAAFLLWLAKIARIPRVPATLLTLAASFAYALFTGFATPVQRSLWMVTLYLLGRLLFRDRSPLNVIGFAALCLLTASPRALFESGFQMTLLAVVSIAGIAMPLLSRTLHPYLESTRNLRLLILDPKLPPRIAQFRLLLRLFAARLHALTNRRLAWRFFPALIRFSLRLGELIVISCVVELAMTLPMALYFHRITLLALPVNLLILPLLTLLVPLALLTLLALLISPTIAAIPAACVAILLHFGVALVHLFGNFAWGDFRIPTPLALQSAAFTALLAAAIVFARTPRRFTKSAAALALLLAAAAAVSPRPIAHPPNALLVEAIDVGQGDSILLISPSGQTLLIDAGGPGGGPRAASQEFDIGDEVVSAALWDRGIRRLDAVALSHAHSDHMGGMPAILRNFRPAELWVGNNPLVPDYRALLSTAARLHTRIRTLRAGDQLPLGDTSITVLAPFPSYHPGPEPKNNDSLVLRAAYRATSVLLEGDAEAPLEHDMLAEPNLASTLLKVGHHGSLTSTRPEFLARVSPQMAVISCGRRNRYHHPRPEVLQELEAAHIRTMETDIGGAACFTLDGTQLQAQPNCRANSAP